MKMKEAILLVLDPEAFAEDNMLDEMKANLIKDVGAVNVRFEELPVTDSDQRAIKTLKNNNFKYLKD